MVKDSTKKTSGAAVPSEMNAGGWNVGEDFQESIAEMARKLCQERSINYLAPFQACRLTPLDKQPGVRTVRIKTSNGKDSNETP